MLLKFSRHYQDTFKGTITSSVMYSHFIQCTFVEIDFSYRAINNSTFANCVFERCNFDNTMISFSNIKSPSFEGCSFRETNIIYTHFSLIQRGEVFVYKVKDNRNFLLLAWRNEEERFCYNAGCRSFSNYRSGIQHWGDPYYVDKERGFSYVDAILNHEWHHGELFCLNSSEIIKMKKDIYEHYK